MYVHTIYKLDLDQLASTEGLLLCIPTAQILSSNTKRPLHIKAFEQIFVFANPFYRVARFCWQPRRGSSKRTMSILHAEYHYRTRVRSSSFNGG